MFFKVVWMWPPLERRSADGGLNSIFSNNLIHGGQSMQENIVLWLAAHGVKAYIAIAASSNRNT